MHTIAPVQFGVGFRCVDSLDACAAHALKTFPAVVRINLIRIRMRTPGLIVAFEVARAELRGGRMSLKKFTAATAMLAAIALFAVAPMREADATLITARFSGELEHIGGLFDPATGAFDGFGLGLDVGDPVSGWFQYDLSGTALAFEATVGALHFIAANLTLGAQPCDQFLTWFYVMGQLENGLFMSIALTHGSPVFSGDIPDHLSSDEWFMSAFRISANATPPIEIQCCVLESIYAVRAGRTGNFVVSTVPEPSSAALAWLVAFVLWRLAELARTR